jgi:hypothetical protein
MPSLKEDEDYYVNDDGFFVFTKEYLLARGYCCESGCRHCPYGFKKKGGKEEPDSPPANPLNEKEKI